METMILSLSENKKRYEMRYDHYCPDDEITMSREEFKEKYETEIFDYKEWSRYIFRTHPILW